MSSSVDICNRALQKLGAERIISLTQNSKEGRACNLAYEPVRDAELRAHTWNFAIKRRELAADATPPVYGYNYSYTLPTDCLRLLKNDYREEYYPKDWKVEGRKILTNYGAPLQIRYVARITDTTLFDPLFIETLSCKLAMEMCEELTQSNTKRQMAAEEYKAVLREARKMNAFENAPAEQDIDTWLTVRL
jgi:hypothetical protein